MKKILAITIMSLFVVNQVLARDSADCFKNCMNNSQYKKDHDIIDEIYCYVYCGPQITSVHNDVKLNHPF